MRDRLAELLASTEADELILAPQSAEVGHRIHSLEVAAGLFATVRGAP